MTTTMLVMPFSSSCSNNRTRESFQLDDQCSVCDSLKDFYQSQRNTISSGNSQRCQHGSEIYCPQMLLRESGPPTNTALGEKMYFNKEKKPTRRSVSFASVHIRDYSVVIGDHPGCDAGLPLSLGWSHTNGETFDIDVYEKNLRRSEHGSASSSRLPTRLTYLERKNLLHRVTGLSECDIIRIERHRVRKQFNEARRLYHEGSSLNQSERQSP